MEDIARWVLLQEDIFRSEKSLHSDTKVNCVRVVNQLREDLQPGIIKKKKHEPYNNF